MSTLLTFDQLPSEVARQGAILEQIQTLLNKLIETPQIHQDEFLDTDEASEFLGIAKSTLYIKVSNREVPNIRRGKKLYFSKQSLIDYLNEGKRKTFVETNDIANSYTEKSRVK